MTRQQEGDEEARCQICDWPLKQRMEDGCIDGNCRYRPREGSAEYYRIRRRREELARPAVQPEDETTLPAMDVTKRKFTLDERFEAAKKIDYIMERDENVVETIGHHGYMPGIIELQCQITALEAERDALKAEVEKQKGSRVHTQEWYASHYGKLQDWARKILPQPWRRQFFNCVANGTYDHDDRGEPYTCVAGFRVVPSGYMHMDDAKGQLVIDQTRRAEDAEAELSTLRSQLDAVVGQETAERAWERAFEDGFYLGREYGMNSTAITFEIPPYTPPLKAGQK